MDISMLIASKCYKLGNFPSFKLSQNFADAEFRKNKTLAKWQKLFFLTDVGNRAKVEIISFFMLFAKNKILVKYSNLQNMGISIRMKRVNII